MNAAQRIECVTGSLRRDGHKVLTVSDRLRLDGVKAAGVVTDAGLYCFPIRRVGFSRSMIAAEFGDFSIALLPPEWPGEGPTSLHDLAERLRLPSRSYLSRFSYEIGGLRSREVLWLLICGHRSAVYPENGHDVLPGDRHQLGAKDLRDIRAFSDVLIDALETFAQRSEDVEVEATVQTPSPPPRLPMTPDGPLRACSDCGRNVVNCAHLAETWCNQCRTYTTKPGLHQNCVPGKWK